MKCWLANVAALLTLAGAGCGREKNGPSDPDGSPDIPFDKAVKKDLAQGNNAFALELYAELRGREGNLFWFFRVSCG